MPRVSKRKRKEEAAVEKLEKVYDLAGIYVRVSEKDGGHGRKESLEAQKQICLEYAEKQKEILLEEVYIDNGVTGTTFEREGFQRLLEDVKKGKINCIIVKDFSRFGRNAVDAVELLDIVFPSLGVRFISVLDGYDSKDPECSKDRVIHILKHFMNDYYAREVSAKLVQAHKLSREKREYWGNRPPYGYDWNPNHKKTLVPNEEEKKVVQQIFEWYVKEGLSGYKITQKLNGMGIASPELGYRMRNHKEIQNQNKYYWSLSFVSSLLQNPIYIGAAVYGKTKKRLCQNIPLSQIHKEQWEVYEDAWPSLISKEVYEKASEISRERRKEELKTWGMKEGKYKDAGVLQGKVICGHCGTACQRTKYSYEERKGKLSFSYYCGRKLSGKELCNMPVILEKYIVKAVEIALFYQMKLAGKWKETVTTKIVQNYEIKMDGYIEKTKKAYESYETKLMKLFEHYATGILEKEEYKSLKEIYLQEQRNLSEELVRLQKEKQENLDHIRMRLKWAEELLEYQDSKRINREIVELFVDEIKVISKKEITVIFYFGDIFEKTVEERRKLDAV